MQASNAGPQRKIIYARYHWQRTIGMVIFFLGGFFLVALAILAAFGLTRAGQSWKTAGIALGSSIPCWFAGLICWVESREFMASSPAGLEYQGFGYKVFFHWDNLEAVRIITTSDNALDPTGTKTRTETENLVLQEVQRISAQIQTIPAQEFIEVLYLSKPVDIQRNWWNKGRWTTTRKIRLMDFPMWRDTGVGGDIRRYVPQLRDYRDNQ